MPTPIEQLQMMQFKSESRQLFGDVICGELAN